MTWLFTWLLLVHISVHTMKKRLCFFPFNMHKKLLQKDTIVSLYIKKHKSANDFYQSSHTWNKQLPMDLLCYGLQQKLLRNLIFLGIIVLQLIFVPAVFTSREAVRLLWVFNHATIYFLVEALFLSNFHCCCWEDDFLSFLYIRQGTFFSSNFF